MLEDSQAFSGFSVNDLAAAKQFYGEVLGITIDDTAMGLGLQFTNGQRVFLYEKANHQPASYTVLNFPVADIDKAVTALVAKGVQFEHYDDPNMPQDDSGILRGRAANRGPDIAWFKDPAGNILSILQD